MPDDNFRCRWLPIAIAPENCDLQVGIAGKGGVTPFHFPCRRVSDNWLNVWSNEPVLIYPTHWRVWRA